MFNNAKKKKKKNIYVYTETDTHAFVFAPNYIEKLIKFEDIYEPLILKIA